MLPQLRARARSMAILCCLFALASFLTGCMPGFPSEEAPMNVANPAVGQLIEPGNRIRLIVFGESSLSGDYTIDSSGNLALPLAGNLQASGLNAATLSERIAAQLQKNSYMRDPQVTVEIQTFRPFYVLGEVHQPGEYAYTHGLTVLSAIARAGGYDYRAWEGEVTLVRQIKGQQKEYRATEKTPILPGDIIRVAQRRF